MQPIAEIETAFAAKLERCGFPDWDAANRRRCQLIRLDVEGNATPEQRAELVELEKLADLRVEMFPECTCQTPSGPDYCRVHAT